MAPQPKILLRNAAEAFDSDGSLVDTKLEAQLRTLIVKTLALSAFLRTQS
jgi:hypothetical protein